MEQNHGSLVFLVQKPWYGFKKLDFGEILKDLNMTRETYINALRMTVKGKHQVFHQRQASDLHINQYNPGLLLLNGANMDFTWIAGNYQPFFVC